MLKGDLVSTPLPAVLRQLADGVASGCLHVLDGVGEAAKVYLRGGQVYAVQVPGRRPQLGARLVSSGSLGPEGLAEALEAQRTELQGWRLGELLVHLGYVDQPVVEAFIKEQVREQTSDLMRWPTGTWKFRVNERTREDVAPPTPVEDLLSEVSQRMAEWATITETVHGPDAVPVLSAAGQSDSEMAIDPEAWSLLCKVDGTRSIAELARECGFTLYEAGQVVYTLVRSGLLEVEEVVIGAEVPEPSGSIASRLAAAFAPSAPEDEFLPEESATEASATEATVPTQSEEPSAAEVASLITKALREDRTARDLAKPKADEVESSLDRVSTALSAALGTTTDENLFAAPKKRTPHVKPMTPAETERAAKKAEKAARDAKRRERDSAELAAAQAELEAARAAQTETYGADHEAEIVNLSEVRRESARREEEEAAEAARAAEAEAVARAAEAEAKAAEAARLEEEAQLAAEAEATRLAAEAEAAEQARLEEEARVAVAAAAEAEAAEQARLDEEARLTQEQARLAQEQADAEAAEATRLAEEAARAAEAEAEAAEAARLEEAARAAEQARAEADAEAAEAQAQAEAAEQARLEDEARVAREQADAEAAEAAEAARFAEERARVEEELRQAAAEQAAAEEAAHAATAAEGEAAKLSAEQAAAEAEHEEQVRANAQRASASDAFAELSASAASAHDVQVLEVDAPADEPEDQVEEAPLPTYGSADTDMASLFRELSSLGMDDEPPPAPARPAASPPRAPAAPVKKKKGLFGR